MTEFISEIKTIPYSVEKVYAILSDLSNLELARDRIPEDKIKNLKFDTNSCSINVAPVGDVTFNIVERKENNTIKFQGEKLPMDMFMWVQLVKSDDLVTKMKITVKAELNVFIKSMVSKPLQDGVNKIADMLSLLPYDDIIDKKDKLTE